jgi:hypothetical protein
VARAEAKQEEVAKEAAAAAASYHAEVKRRDLAVAVAEAEAMRCRDAQIGLASKHTSEVAEEREKVRVSLEKADRDIRGLMEE